MANARSLAEAFGDFGVQDLATREPTTDLSIESPQNTAAIASSIFRPCMLSSNYIRPASLGKHLQ